MAIRTYPELLVEVESWLNRDDPDTISRIPSFINFAEKEIYRVLKLPVYENIVRLSIANNRCEVPFNLVQLKEIYTSDNRIGRQTSHRELINIENGHSQAYNDFYYARVGNEYHFQSAVSIQGVDVFCHYFRDPEHLDNNNNQTTPLLDLAPDLVLFTALRHGAVYAEDTEKAAYWEQRSDNAMQEIVKQLDDDNMSGSPQAMERPNGDAVFW